MYRHCELIDESVARRFVREGLGERQDLACGVGGASLGDFVSQLFEQGSHFDG